MQKSLTVDVAIWLFSSIMKKRVNASYLAVGPAPPTVSLKAVRPWTDCRAIPSLRGAQPAQRCRLYQKLPYAARSSFKAVPREAVSQDCVCVREASVSTKSGPGRHRAADLAVIVTSRSSERSLPGKTPPGGHLHRFCMMFAHQYELWFSKTSCCPHVWAWLRSSTAHLIKPFEQSLPRVFQWSHEGSGVRKKHRTKGKTPMWT